MYKACTLWKPHIDAPTRRHQTRALLPKGNVSHGAFQPKSRVNGHQFHPLFGQGKAPLGNFTPQLPYQANRFCLLATTSRITPKGRSSVRMAQLIPKKPVLRQERPFLGKRSQILDTIDKIFWLRLCCRSHDMYHLLYMSLHVLHIYPSCGRTGTLIPTKWDMTL
jgi:hypothetical protein